MREKLEWGRTTYYVFKGDEIVLEQKDVACFSEFMSRFSKKYDKIRIYDLDCEQTKEYKEFYLQYVIDMLNIQASFNEEYFEFKTTGYRYKDAAVMSIVRLIWEQFLNHHGNIDTPNLLFKRLRDDECEHEDKLKRFCYFYSQIPIPSSGYASEGHSWLPKKGLIKSTKEFEEHTSWGSVNGFFIR